MSEAVRVRAVSCEPRDRPQERGETEVFGMLNGSTIVASSSPPPLRPGIRQKGVSSQGENAITCVIRARSANREGEVKWRDPKSNKEP